MNRIIIVCFLILSLHAQDEYQLGKGVQVGSLPFYLGGYFSVDYRNLDGENRYRVDDLAILGYGSYEKLSYMLELEFKEFYVETHKNDMVEIKKDTNLHAERVYIDYNFNENYMLRVGKYNSSIGFWNLLPVNVLRETTSNPVSSNILFPKFTTGLNAAYSSYDSGEFKIDVMLQNNEDIDDEYNNYKIDNHYGFGISYEKDDFTLKFNSGYFHKTKDEIPNNLYYFLISSRYESEKFQILTEIGSQKSKDEFTTNFAGYIQGVYRFTEEHLGVVRVESYDDVSTNTNDNLAIFGYTYRPLYPIAIKTEYQFHSISKQNQFLFSFSVLF